MTVLSDAATGYLQLRRSLGHQLDDAHRLLPRFVEYLDSLGAPTVTIETALAWAQQPDVNPASSVWPHRMTVARGFARHMASLDARTEIPPPGLIPSRQRWRPPFIFTPADIDILMAQTRLLHHPFKAASHETVIGLLAATGMRVGEAIKLDRTDIDWAAGVLSIRESKFGKSRLVPVHPSTIAALDRYAELRDHPQPRPSTPSFFVSTRGTRLIYQVVHHVFRHSCDTAQIGAGSNIRPRIHDLRHSFTVATLLEWYRAGENVELRLPALSTYLGHRDPRSTYWYLSAAPELLALAAGRLELSRGVIKK